MCAPVPRVPRNSNFHKSYAATRMPGIRFLVNNYKKIASKSFPVSKFYFSNLKLNIFNLLDNQLTGIVPSAFSLSFYNSSLTGNPGFCSNDGLEGLKSCSDMEDGRRRKCKKQEWHTDDILSQKHSKFTSLKCPNWCLVDIQNHCHWTPAHIKIACKTATEILPGHIDENLTSGFSRH